MRTNLGRGAKPGWLAGGTLATLALLMLAVSGSQTPTRAQEAPKPVEQKTLLFSADELAIWTDYLHGDCEAAYGKVTKSVASSNERFVDAWRAAIALQRNLALELGEDIKHGQDLERLIEKSAEDWEKNKPRFELTQSLRRTGRNVDADEQASKLGYITNWWICGPFPNERGQGFEEEQGPESELSLTKVYTGKDGQACSFRPLPAMPIDGVIDVGAMVRPNSEATAFLLTAIWAGENTSYRADWGSTGDAAAFLAGGFMSGGYEFQPRAIGSPLLLHTGERPFGFDQAIHSDWFDLVKGWNVCVIKLGHSEGPWTFRMRLEGSTGIRVATTAEELTQALASVTRREIDSAVGLQESAGLPNVHDALCELLTPRFETSSDTARRYLSNILTDFEKSVAANKASPAETSHERTILTFLLAEASKSQVRVASGREENKRRELLEKVLELDPKAARAALELAKYYSGTFRNPTESDRYARLAVSLAPRWVEARVFAARVAGMKGLDGEIERELNSLLKEFPEHPAVLRYAGYYRGLRGDYAGSDELFKRCLYKGDYTDTYARERLFSRAVERLDVDAAVQYAGQTRSLNPFDLDTSAGLIKLHLARGYNASALDECERALNICPRDDNFLASKGEILLRMAAKAEGETAAALCKRAIEAYREALVANPNRADLARYLEYIAEEKPKWEYALQESIEPRILEALKQPLDGNDPYRIVYRDEINVVNEDGTKSVYSQYAYRVCNDDGREMLQGLDAPAYSEQTARCVGARVYRADGSTEEGRRVEARAEFPPLRIGDIVHVRFRISDTAQTFFGDFFGAIETLADYVPVDEVRLVYVLPTSRKFYEYRTNGAPARNESLIDNKIVWSYGAKNLARVPTEPMAPPLEQSAPAVQLSTYETWAEFGKWYYNLIKKQLEPTPEMRTKVAELTAGKTSERDKARAIYNWVVTAVRYNADWHFGVHGYKPFSAGAIFERCIGDCKDKAILMVTMLGVAGIKAYPVIIKLEEYRGHEDITLPMPHHFNHAIACIEYSDGSSQFLDGTATFNGFDELPGADAGASVIIVKPDGGVRAVVPIPSVEACSSASETTLEFLGQGKIKLTVKETANGDRASFLRGSYLREGDRARRIEARWSRHKAGAKVIAVKANDLSDINLVPEVTYSIELPDAYSIDAHGNIELKVALDPLEWTKGFAPQAARRTDLLLSSPYGWLSTLTFKVPAGLRLEQIPEAFSGENVWGRFGVSVEQTADSITVKRSYTILGGVVPKADYPALRKLLGEFDRAEAAQLRLVK